MREVASALEGSSNPEVTKRAPTKLSRAGRLLEIHLMIERMRLAFVSISGRTCARVLGSSLANIVPCWILAKDFHRPLIYMEKISPYLCGSGGFGHCNRH